VVLVANVALITWFVSASLTVHPTASCVGWLLVPFSGCSPVTVGSVFVVSKLK